MPTGNPRRGDIDFSGRVAIVTGAGNNLGKTYALQLAARGAHVVVNDFGGNPDGSGHASGPADLVVSEIRAAGGKAVASYDSVATRPGCDNILAAAMDAYGRVDIVINNAGNQRNARFEDMTDEDFDAVLDVHLKGAFWLSQAAYKVMMRQCYGRLLFTSSASGMFGNYICTNYSAAKAGIVGLMHSTAIEGARYGILANALLPGALGTRLGKAPPNAMHPDWEAAGPEHKPGMELALPSMTADYVSPLVLYLVSDQCTSTHALWSAIGGRYARTFIGCTKGWLAPAGPAPAPEDVRDHLIEIEARADFDEPLSVADEIGHFIEALKQRRT